MKLLHSVLFILISYSSLASFSEDYPCISENYQVNPKFSPSKLNYQIGKIKEYPNMVISVSWEPEFYDGHFRIIGPASIKFLRKTDDKFFIIKTFWGTTSYKNVCDCKAGSIEDKENICKFSKFFRRTIFFFYRDYEYST